MNFVLRFPRSAYEIILPSAFVYSMRHDVTSSSTILLSPPPEELFPYIPQSGNVTLQLCTLSVIVCMISSDNALQCTHYIHFAMDFPWKTYADWLRSHVCERLASQLIHWVAATNWIKLLHKIVHNLGDKLQTTFLYLNLFIFLMSRIDPAHISYIFWNIQYS